MAEYRPNSKALLYRVAPDTLNAELLLHAQDHIGGLLRHPESGDLHGVSWGSRRFYQWRETADGFAPEPSVSLNRSFYVDYQDCQWQPELTMLCSGLGRLLGGIELVDLRSGQQLWQRPLTLRAATTDDLVTRNPFYFDAEEQSLYFVPEDDQSTLYQFRLVE